MFKSKVINFVSWLVSEEIIAVYIISDDKQWVELIRNSSIYTEPPIASIIFKVTGVIILGVNDINSNAELHGTVIIN